MIHLPRDFHDFIELLNEHGVEYVVIGGYALAVHGYVRYTGDIDFFIALHTENAEKMLRVFHAFGLDTPDLDATLFMDEGKIIRVGSEPMRLEVLNKISGVDFAECYQNRKQILVDGISVNFIGYNELLENKSVAGRPKDLADIDELRKRKS